MFIKEPLKHPYECKKCGKQLWIYSGSFGFDPFNDSKGEPLPKEYNELCKDGKKHEWEKVPVIF